MVNCARNCALPTWAWAKHGTRRPTSIWPSSSTRQSCYRSPPSHVTLAHRSVLVESGVVCDVELCVWMVKGGGGRLLGPGAYLRSAVGADYRQDLSGARICDCSPFLLQVQRQVATNFNQHHQIPGAFAVMHCLRRRDQAHPCECLKLQSGTQLDATVASAEAVPIRFHLQGPCRTHSLRHTNGISSVQQSSDSSNSDSSYSRA